ncbi:hypothetical protein LJB42_001354 [Komagataella kurtzmanii]|nr:hypothetical protein LJB42_001354 [Komagataella kurtzmanii]
MAKKKVVAPDNQPSVFSFFKKKPSVNSAEPKKEQKLPTPSSSPQKADLSSGTSDKENHPTTPTKNEHKTQLPSASSSVVRANKLEDDEEEGIVSGRKRHRVAIDSEDEEDAFDEEESVDNDDDEDYNEDDLHNISDEYFEISTQEMMQLEKELEGEEEPHNSEGEEEEEVHQVKPLKKSKQSTSQKLNQFGWTPSFSSQNDAKGKTANNQVKRSNLINPLKPKASKKLDEERYHWLEDVRDAEGRAQGDPEYDPRTLFIPSSAWSSFTPFEKQYWEIKSKMYDCVVFFKKGKFYELYENDADIAHNEFDLKLAGGGRANMRLAGVPEMSFDYWANAFINAGYKVAKVDQKESMLAKEIREKGKTITKEEKVIKRELQCVLTGGTLTDESMLTDEMATYCLSLKEVDNGLDGRTFGVCFVDTATGKMRLTEFEDSVECTRLETLLAQVRPREVLVAKNQISPLTARILRFNSPSSCIWNKLKPDTEFLNHEVTFEELTRGKYFEASDLDDLSNYPPLLVEYHEKHHVAFSAFGALLWYLKSLKLDESIISMGNISPYDPYQHATSMTMDGVTLQNLEIFANTFDGSNKGTLFKVLNRATTPFGKRLFKDWVVHPLLLKKSIDERLDSVELLLNDGELKHIFINTLSRLPDLERLLSRIHSGSLKIQDFTKVIEGFERISKLVRTLRSSFGENFESIGGSFGKILSQLPQELEIQVSKWATSFDRVAATSQGLLIPEPGVEVEFDQSKLKIENLKDKLNQFLRQYRREFKCQEMEFRDSGKEIYLIEVPKKVISKVPKDWQQMGSTSKVTRYWSPEVKLVVRELMEATELHKILMDTLQLKVYRKFDENYSLWSETIRCIGSIDCLISLANASESLGSPSCRPEIVDKDEAFIDFEELRHPCFIPGGASGSRDFIPNDVKLGNGSANIALLTGANAAGKSTVLRMTCIATIMAQIGCFVPASKATLVPVDKIMTRLGANDNIMQGKSTFYVELSETKRILQNATPRSLLVLDELGRGGSSSDGFAIAEACLHHIATHIQSIGFFATHYGTLGASFIGHPQVMPLRMAILVDESSKTITFLYKLEKGASNGSFGMHVATMCGIPKEIVDNVEIAAKNLKHNSMITQVSKAGVSLGLQSDISWLTAGKDIGAGITKYNEKIRKKGLEYILQMIEGIK